MDTLRIKSQRVWPHRLLLPLFLALLLLSTSQIASPAATAQTIPVASLRNPDGTLNLNSNVHGTLDLRGWKVTLDPTRGPILSPASDPASVLSTWSAFPHKGLNNSVITMAVMGNDLYLGGFFSQSVDGAVKNLNNIVKFSGGAWHSLPHRGLNGFVLALTVVGSDLFVGGHFTQTADGAVTNLNNIARFDGTKWNALPHRGLNANVEAITVLGKDMFVAGHFTQTADGAVINLNNIAKLKGGTKWKALPNQGLNGAAFAFGVLGTDLFVGGSFTATNDGSITHLNKIAKFSGGVWHALPHDGLDAFVDALAVLGTDLYIGGPFTQTADGVVKNLNHIARLKGGTIWKALPHGGLDSYVAGFAVLGNDLYIGGGFTKTADGVITNLNNLALLKDGSKWRSTPNNGLNGNVNALRGLGDDLYVGGNFSQTADGQVKKLNNIAKLTP